jgi:hypothetical protein
LLIRLADFSISYGKSMTSQGPPSNYLYLFVWVKLCILFIFFSNSPSAIEHILNWNVRQAWKNLYTVGILSYKNSCCLVPFSSNISWAQPHRPLLFWLDKKKSSPGTSEVHSKKMLVLSTPSFRCSCDGSAWQIESGFAGSMWYCCCYEVCRTAEWIMRKNDTALCMAKQQTYEVSKITGMLTN